jgi:uncharacterized membrane protein YqjE
MPASSPDASTAKARGLLAEFAALLGAKLAYLRARFELAGIEGKEALANLAIILALAVGALVVVVFGYFFVVTALVFLIAWACGGGNAWIWVMIGAGVLHFIVAAGLGLAIRMRLDRRMFEATLDEFRKDQEWLTTRGNPN